MWSRNDALRKQGILPEKPPDPNDQFEEALQKAVQEAEQNRLENLNLAELAELEDDEDDEFLESYRFVWSFNGNWPVDKSACKKCVTFNQRVDLGALNPSVSQTLSKKSQKQANRHGSLFIYSRISIIYPQTPMLTGKYTTMQITSYCAQRFCQEIPDAQDTKDTRWPVYRRIPWQANADATGVWTKGVSIANCWFGWTRRKQYSSAGFVKICGSSLRLDLERYAEKIGALSKAELRVTKDQDDEEFPHERNQMRKSVVKKDDEDDDWE